MLVLNTLAEIANIIYRMNGGFVLSVKELSVSVKVLGGGRLP